MRLLGKLGVGLVVWSGLAFPGAAADLDWDGPRRERFQKCTKAFEEPALDAAAARDAKAEVYRLYYLPSFFPQVSFRLNVVPAGTGRLTVRWKRGYCEPGPLEERTFGVSQENVVRLREAFSAASFWSMTFTEYSDPNVEHVVCSDGIGIHIEGVNGGRYHHISRSCSSWSEAVDTIIGLFHQFAHMKTVDERLRDRGLRGGRDN
jgi:hypothetical protein